MLRQRWTGPGADPRVTWGCCRSGAHAAQEGRGHCRVLPSLAEGISGRQEGVTSWQKPVDGQAGVSLHGAGAANIAHKGHTVNS